MAFILRKLLFLILMLPLVAGCQKEEVSTSEAPKTQEEMDVTILGTYFLTGDAFTHFRTSSLLTRADINAPAIVSKPRDAVATEGETIYFAASVTALVFPTVKWYKDGREIVPGGRFSKLTRESGGHKYEFYLEIAGVVLEDAGEYMIVVQNKHGEMRAGFTLRVIEA